VVCQGRLAERLPGDRRAGPARGTGRTADRLDKYQSSPGVIDRAARVGRKKEDADHRRCLGRSRGGLTTKVHAATGKNGRLIDLRLTAGQRGDAPEEERLLDIFDPGEVGTIIADAVYDSDAIRKRGRRLKAKVCIKPNATRKSKKRYNRTVYKHRNQIERFFGRIKRCRRIATRYEKKPANFASFIWLAALITDMI